MKDKSVFEAYSDDVEAHERCCEKGYFGQAHDCMKQPDTPSAPESTPSAREWWIYYPNHQEMDVGCALYSQRKAMSNNGAEFRAIEYSAFEQMRRERDELRLAKPNAGSTDTLTEKYRLREECDKLTKELAEARDTLAQESARNENARFYQELRHERARGVRLIEAFEYLVSRLPESETAGFVTHARAIISGDEEEIEKTR